MQNVKYLILWFSFICASVVTASLAQAQSVALTFDDGPNLEETPLMSAQQRNQAMLYALAKHGVKAALFVTANNGANQAAGLELARAWGEAGHAIGNHTMSHLDLNSANTSLVQYQQELLDCDKIISTLPGYQKWFRYTYLREGNTPEKRDGMRDFLKQHAYRNAYVSLDTSDWRLNDRLIEVLKNNSKADAKLIEPIKKAYLAHLRQRAIAYHELSKKLQGRAIPHVMLMHHNLINALFLDDVIVMFKEMGWTITSPAAAYDDPIYQLMPDRAVAGQSLLLSMARTLGLGKFDGWERLVDDGDFEIEVLNETLNKTLKLQGL
jgi:peptidoglycan/xylan/chitin deacetylase (PgdA/CDA1 family)